MLSWKQQVQKLFRSVPRKSIIDLASYRHPRSRAFGQSSSLPTVGCVGGGISARRNVRQFHVPSRSLPSARIGLLGTSSILGTSHRSTPTCLKQCRQGLWFANPGGSNSIPSRSHSSVQRTRSLPVHATPQAAFMFQQAEFQSPATEPDINNRLESLCLSVTEHALDEKFEHMKKTGDYYVVVVEDVNIGTIIATATLIIEHKFIHSCAKRGRIEEVVVTDECRGKQLGKLLVSTLTLMSKKLNCYKITLECLPKNVAFYEKFGYCTSAEAYMQHRFFD
ncbi:SMAG1 protein, partial [Polypterus senegalus]